MKPLLLNIEGLNSFQEQQTIDFSKLMCNGLFGIFGNTGSGKSTILDAISLALYGYIPRSSSEFINSNMDRAIVSFKFELNVEGKKEVFSVERMFKREKEGGYKTGTARIYNESQQTFIAEGAKQVTQMSEELIGLKAEDFMRTIVLPQGKFSEFLTLTAKNRGEMLERIFHLEEYGKQLTDKILAEKNILKDEDNKLKAAIDVYGDISEEKIKQTKVELEQSDNVLNDLVKSLQIAQTNYQKAEQLWGLQNEKTRYMSKKDELTKECEQINIKRKSLDMAQRADRVFPYIKNKVETQKKYDEVITALNTKQEKKDALLKEYDEKKGKYDEAVKRKELEYEPLLHEKENLARAISIKNDIDRLSNELNELKTNIAIFSKDKKSLQVKKDNLDILLVDNNKELNEVITQKEKVKIDPEYRKHINRACEVKKLCLRIKEEAKDQESILLNITLELSNLAKKKEEVVKNKAIQEAEMLSEKNKLETLMQSDPQSEITLLEFQERLNIRTVKLEEIKKASLLLEQKDKYLTELKQQFLQLTEKRQCIEENLEEQKCKLKEIEEQEKALNILNMSGIIAQGLSDGQKCPVCGSLHHPERASKLQDGMEELIKQNFSETNESLEIVKKEYNLVLTDLKVNENETNRINNEIENISQGHSPKELEKMESELVEQEKIFEDMQKQVKLWKDATEQSTNALNEKNLKYNLCITELEHILELEEKSKEQHTKEQKVLADKEQAISKHQGEIDKYINELGFDDFEQRQEQLIALETEYVEIEKKESILRNTIKENETKSLELLNTINEIQIKEETQKQTFVEKESIFKQYKKQIEELTNGQSNLKGRMDIVSKSLDELIENEKSFYNELTNCSQEKQELNDACIGIQKQAETLSKFIKEYTEEADKALKEYSFVDFEEVNDSILSSTEQLELQQQINEYDSEMKTIEDNIQRIDAILNKKEISILEYEHIKQEHDNLLTELEECKENKIKLSTRYEEMDSKFGELSKLLETYKKNAEKLEMTTELTELIRGNKFVSFVAKRHILYVAKEASKYLKKISKGRYAIEIDDSDDFVVRDNFNSGIRRRVGTLSGGEIFITSLCMAIALSSQIQLKNKAPLEFFFLDEGFGSLDEELLDTVIDTLEMLYLENMHIGIISHVEELKNRIPSKLVVISGKQDFQGSTIRMET